MRWCSHSEPLRRRLPVARHRQGQRPAVVHGRQAEDSREHHEGHQDGAGSEEGSGQG